MAYFIQNNFVQINLNKNDLNKYRGASLRWIRFIRIPKRRNINCGIASVCQRWL